MATTRARARISRCRSRACWLLPGTAAGHTFGLHPALAPLVNLYTQERLAFIANVGPLIEPATAAQVLAGTVDVPPFLMSHNDQTAIVQGWTVQDDTSGWAGRALELLPSRLQNRLAAVTSDTNRTLVLGRRSPVSFMDGNGNNSWWGIGDLGRPQEIGAQSLGRMAQWQFANAYEAEYARTYGMAFDDGTFIAQARAAVVEPTARLRQHRRTEWPRACATWPRCCRTSGRRASSARCSCRAGAASTPTPTSVAATATRRTHSSPCWARRWRRSTRPTAPTAWT